jgi:hypothetical protein
MLRVVSIRIGDHLDNCSDVKPIQKGRKEMLGIFNVSTLMNTPVLLPTQHDNRYFDFFFFFIN